MTRMICLDGAVVRIDADRVVVDLAARGLLRPTVTTVPLQDAVEAYRRMESGSVLGRQVVVPGTAACPVRFFRGLRWGLEASGSGISIN